MLGAPEPSAVAPALPGAAGLPCGSLAQVPSRWDGRGHSSSGSNTNPIARPLLEAASFVQSLPGFPTAGSPAGRSTAASAPRAGDRGGSPTR